MLRRLETHSTEPALVIWNNDDTRTELTATELLERVRRLCGGIRHLEIHRDSIVIFALGHSEDLICCFLAALFAGAQPVIFNYPDDQKTTGVYLTQLSDLIRQSGATVVVTEVQLKWALSGFLSGDDCRVFETADLSRVEADSVAGAAAPGCESGAWLSPGSGEDIAYLQYTSGSSGRRKGVMLSHRAVLANISAMQSAFQMTAADVAVNWLPLYHDFGLVLGLLAPLALGARVILMSPQKWVRRPVVLLNAIHEYRGTMTCLPNSAMTHMVRTVRREALSRYSLSTVRLINWGSEPCRMKTYQDFVTHFSAAGLQPEALTVGYGMAEMTLCVTSGAIAESIQAEWLDVDHLTLHRRAIGVPADSPSASCYLSCGVPLPESRVRIVDEEGTTLPDRTVGEICVHSPSMFSGYHSSSELTAKVVRDGWYLTGDMGFLNNGELYFCDRKSDLIIVGGQNIHASDVEGVVAGISGVRETGVVVFGVPNAMTGTNSLIVLCELTRRHTEAERRQLELQLRRAVQESIGVVPNEVLLVGRGELIKTANGKLARRENRDRYLAERRQVRRAA
ncbi:MAG: AMP-binding protein [Planctomycetaceae bacterium]|nr:AMP-binding protein [Planctomycetaceae bacterium]